MRPRAFSLARQNSARRKPQDFAGGARQKDTRRAFYNRGAGTAYTGDGINMSFYRTFAIVLRQFYLIRGSFSRVFPLFAWIGVDMILWGFLTKYLNTMAPPGFNFVPALLGAVLLWDFCIRIMQGVTMAFFEDVWSRNFLNIFATPLLVSEYVAGLVLSSIMTSVVGLTAMVFIAVPFFKLSFLIYGLMIIPFFLVLFLFGISLGIFGS